MTNNIPIITDMRKLPAKYKAFTFFDKQPSEENAELAREGYRVVTGCEPGRVLFYAAPDGKLSYYVVEDSPDCGRKGKKRE